MKRLLKLLMSLLVRGWDVGRTTALRMTGRRPSPTCVVLYYHGIGAGQRERFARQMNEVLRLTQPIHIGAELKPNGAERYCGITFDDGFVSVMENALPELETRRIPATLFVPTGNMGSRPAWITNPASPANHERVVSRAELAALKDRQLVTVGSHSVSHPNFVKLDEAQATVEFKQSKADLEAVLGRPVRLFSFPHGAYNQSLLELAREAGYERVLTIKPECISVPDANFVQGRVAVGPDDWPLEFRLKLLGAYRWLARV
jgi:peptidoglycan/xylan/chitin deacetylase (PgdA/CDA1 family)